MTGSSVQQLMSIPFFSIQNAAQLATGLTTRRSSLIDGAKSTGDHLCDAAL